MVETATIITKNTSEMCQNLRPVTEKLHKQLNSNSKSYR